MFRTEIDMEPARPINMTDRIVMLGSCFTDNIGEMLAAGGYYTVHNPLGPLYNPASIARAIRLALTDAENRKYTYRADDDNKWHCLDFSARRVYSDWGDMDDDMNTRLDTLGRNLRACDVLILTLGTAYVYSLDGTVVGNCHKFPNKMFVRSLLSVEQCVTLLGEIRGMLPRARVIYTVSPIRHLSDGMHGNQISKSTLLLAIDKLGAEYFPAYEIMMDDLRDYRYYDYDMKHPSRLAIEYIHDKFSGRYFPPKDIETARLARKQARRQQHRQILTGK